MENKTIYFLNIEENCYIFKESLTGIMDFERIITNKEKDKWLEENVGNFKKKSIFYPDLSVIISGVIYTRFPINYSPYIEMFSNVENLDYKNIRGISDIIPVLYYLSFGYAGGIKDVLSEFAYENTIIFTLIKYFADNLRSDIFFIPYYYSFDGSKSDVFENIIRDKSIDKYSDFSKRLRKLYSFIKDDIKAANSHELDKIASEYYQDRILSRNESLLLPIVGIYYYDFNDYLDDFIGEKNSKIFSKEESKKISCDFYNAIGSYKIFLQYEPFNIYDNNAVAVCLIRENKFVEKIGYLRRDFAKILNPIFRNNVMMKGEIVLITAYGDEGSNKEIIIRVKKE